MGLSSSVKTFSCGMWDLAQPEMEPGPRALGMWSLSHYGQWDLDPVASASVLLTFSAREYLPCCGHCPAVHGRFSSIPGLFPLDARRKPPPLPGVTNVSPTPWVQAEGSWFRTKGARGTQGKEGYGYWEVWQRW